MALRNTQPDLRALDRILGELEARVRSDEAALKRKDYSYLSQNQSIKNDLVRKLVELCADGVPTVYEKRVGALMQQQQANAAWLSEAMEANRTERNSLLKGRRQVRRLNQSYGTPNRPEARRKKVAADTPKLTRFLGVA